MCVYVYVYTCTHMYVQMCVYVCLYNCTYVCVCECAFQKHPLNLSLFVTSFSLKDLQAVFDAWSAEEESGFQRKLFGFAKEGLGLRSLPFQN